MADIHILRGTVRNIYRTSYQYVLHVPTGIAQEIRDRMASDPDIANFQSAVPDIAQVELDAIHAGDLVEVQGTISYHRDDPPGDYLERLRARFTELEAVIPDRITRQYQWYMNAYSAT